MGVQYPVCPKAGTGGRFMSTRQLRRPSQEEDQMASFREMLDKPGVAGGAVAGGIVGLLASVLVALAPGIVSGVANYASFARNVAIEAIRNTQTPPHLKPPLALPSPPTLLPHKHLPQT